MTLKFGKNALFFSPTELFGIDRLRGGGFKHSWIGLSTVEILIQIRGRIFKTTEAGEDCWLKGEWMFKGRVYWFFRSDKTSKVANFCLNSSVEN